MPASPGDTYLVGIPWLLLYSAMSCALKSSPQDSNASNKREGLSFNVAMYDSNVSSIEVSK